MRVGVRFLLHCLLVHVALAEDLWIPPQSASFHHALDFLRARANVTQRLPSFPLTLPSLLPLTSNETACQKDLVLLLNGLIDQEKWALKVIDAWGTKPPAGLLEGSHLWLGSYDECLHSLYLPSNRTHVQQPYPTRYCTAIDGPIDDESVMFQKPALIIGLCLPHSCKPTDFTIDSFSIRCRTDRRPFPIGAILTLVLIALLSVFVCSAAFIPRLHEYSALSTLKRIFSTNNDNAQYTFFNGIRILSLLWIILGHSYVFQLTISDNVIHVLDNLHQSLIMQLLFGAVFAVDTFFFISGFLAVLVFMAAFKNVDAIRVQHILVYYLHRYCRLLPTLVFVLLVSMHLTPWMGDGPIFPRSTGFEVPACRQHWWTTLLFVNNLISPTTACLAVTWYLANDFQFHLLAPLLLIPYINGRRRWTYALLAMLLLANVATLMGIIGTHPGLETGFTNDDAPSIDYFEKIYITPWCRIGAFLIGMITKLLLDAYPARLSSIKMLLGSVVSIAVTLLCIFFPFYTRQCPRFIAVIYQSISHQCWAMVIGWLVFVCSTSPQSVVNRMLSWPLWTVLARLSYPAYLIHTTIILVQVYNRLSTMHYQTSVLFNAFVSQSVLTLFASIVVVVLVERPCTVLERHLRRYWKERQSIVASRQGYGAIT